MMLVAVMKRGKCSVVVGLICLLLLFDVLFCEKLMPLNLLILFALLATYLS